MTSGGEVNRLLRDEPPPVNMGRVRPRPDRPGCNRGSVVITSDHSGKDSPLRETKTMKTFILSASALAAVTLMSGAAFADASTPAATMQPIANPPEAAKPVNHGHHHAKHHAKHHHHGK